MVVAHDPRIIVALDVSDRNHLEALIKQLSPQLCRLKVGKELFTTFGPDIVQWLHSYGFEVFLDLKFHDIPNTTANAVRASARLGVWMLNVHVLGGRRMMQACREVLREFENPPLLIGVTILTSLESHDLREVGVSLSAGQAVSRLGTLAKQSGLDGVVCSAREVKELRRELGESFCLVTPGIRPVSASADDQARIVTPAQAIADGSHYLVIGRPITQAANPAKSLAAISEEIQSPQD